MRADLALISLQLAKSRTHAQDLIKEGVVYYHESVVKKSSQEIADTSKLSVKKTVIFVSRGAYKLLSAIDSFSINFNGLVVADVGASTGGFTEVALMNGAAKVFAIDVGHDQLADKLKNDPRVINLEGLNIKNGVVLSELVDIVVADLSFISLKLVILPMMKLIKFGGEAIVLIKPQFEVGQKGIGKNGIVKEGEFTKNAIVELYNFLVENNIAIYDCAKSDIVGKDGNQEYFFYLGNGTNSKLSFTELETKFEAWGI